MGFGLGPAEMIFIVVVILLLFGAKKVPEIGSSIGKGIREFKKSLSDVDKQVRSGDEEVRSRERLSPGERDSIPTAHDDEVRPEPRRLI